MKKTYKKLSSEPIQIELEGSFMAASIVDAVELKVEVDDYVTIESGVTFE